MKIEQSLLRSADAPLMVYLAQPMDYVASPTLGAMTKYKTFTGEEINGQKIWNYDYHDDD